MNVAVQRDYYVRCEKCVVLIYRPPRKTACVRVYISSSKYLVITENARFHLEFTRLTSSKCTIHEGLGYDCNFSRAFHYFHYNFRK